MGGLKSKSGRYGAGSRQGDVTIRTAVLTDEESKRYFGASLADYGVQAVWLSVNNASDLLLRFLPIVSDPNYFTAPEVARLLRVWWRGSPRRCREFRRRFGGRPTA